MRETKLNYRISFKMTTNFRFFYNLDKQTFNARINGFVDPEGYLQSIHRYTPQFINFCLTLGRQHSEVIFADNGFFRKISLTVKKFSQDSNQLYKEITKLEKSLKHNVRRNEVPKNLQDQYKVLVKNIKSHIKEIEKNTDPKETLKEEQRIEPERFICREDILMASLVGLNIEPEYVKEKSRFYSYRNRRSARFYNKTKSGSYGSFNGEPYAVASAVDYNSAFSAGREMARGEATHLAMGVGAYMADSNFVDYFQKRRKTFEFDSKIPRRYLRTALAVKGLIDGYEKKMNKQPDGLHMLGLRDPIMILITALIASKVKEFSCDATSPIKDAVTGTIYFKKPSYKKVRARKLALIFCKHPENKWWCKCSYCKHYIKKHPFNVKKAASWYKKNGSPKKITRNNLHGDTELAKALPMFGEPQGGQKRKDIDDWRIGHNHLILEHLFKDLNKNNKQKKLLQFVTKEVNKYSKTTSSTYAKAAKTSLSIATNKI